MTNETIHECEFGHGPKAQSCYGRWDCPVCEAETARRELEAEQGYERYLETRMTDDGERGFFG